MTRLTYILALFGILLASVTHGQEDTDDIVENSNAISECDNSANALALYVAKRTCIDSTEFRGTRCFYTYIPDCAGENSPLVFDLHGYLSCPCSAPFTQAGGNWHKRIALCSFGLWEPLILPLRIIHAGECLVDY